MWVAGEIKKVGAHGVQAKKTRRSPGGSGGMNRQQKNKNNYGSKKDSMRFIFCRAFYFYDKGVKKCFLPAPWMKSRGDSFT